ncbi:metal-dependent hydrolase [Clostridium cylindrosporum]|uniref:Putative membrane-bound metal-dependent hydrolase n=1 Tax=Clostridium cylindrosporum DSM 605 TaxID=1121307 RepID=A0A0J8D9V5_CLOCY|nr:metal-dependent hydrolase [Clostridium cylindrosporum]KMT21073.1 putative membrane-bound metal-dependent hydrolase [Clostridium cylindrosporum DSM 605]
MTGKTHIGVGLLTAVVIMDKQGIGITPLSILICIFASILPDADHPKGVFNKYLLPVRNKTVKLAIYLGLGATIIGMNYLYFSKPYLYGLGTVLIMIGVSSHREGITHSLIGFIAIVYIVGYGSQGIDALERKRIIVSLIAGYGSHLLGDMFTNRGVPLFYPFNKKKFKMPATFKVGSGVGNLIEGIIIALGIIYLTFKIPMMVINMN